MCKTTLEAGHPQFLPTSLAQACDELILQVLSLDQGQHYNNLMPTNAHTQYTRIGENNHDCALGTRYIYNKLYTTPYYPPPRREKEVLLHQHVSSLADEV